MIHYFKIYGQMRTGTNYISTLLLKNFLNSKVFMNVGGWKHGEFIQYPNNLNLLNRVDDDTKKKINIVKTIKLFQMNKINFIVIIKNPYMWIKSICNFNKKPINDISYIIKQISTWNKYYKDYKQYIENGNAYLIKYELLLKMY
jgi:hypothetical protein